MGARRPRWAIGVVVLALLASVAAAVAVVGRGHGEGGAAPSAARAYPTGPAIGAPREPDAAPVSGRSRQERAALAAARRFLAGYLPYSYGQAPASRIVAATAPLARALRRHPPRVPASTRRLAPRLVALQVASVNG